MAYRVLVSALAGAVVVFVMAGVLFGVIFADFFASSIPLSLAGVNRDTPMFLLIAAADLLYAVLLAFLLASLAGPLSVRRGALFGGMIGLVVVVHFDLLKAATTYLATPQAIVANALLSGLMSAVAGGVIAAVQVRLAKGRS